MAVPSRELVLSRSIRLEVHQQDREAVLESHYYSGSVKVTIGVVEIRLLPLGSLRTCFQSLGCHSVPQSYQSRHYSQNPHLLKESILGSHLLPHNIETLPAINKLGSKLSPGVHTPSHSQHVALCKRIQQAESTWSIRPSLPLPAYRPPKYLKAAVTGTRYHIQHQ